MQIETSLQGCSILINNIVALTGDGTNNAACCALYRKSIVRQKYFRFVAM